MNKIFLTLIFIITITINTKSQIQLESINAGLSLGSITSNSPSFTSFGGKISTDFKLWFSEYVKFRFGFEHSRMIEYFLPNDGITRTYPFINNYFLSSVINQLVYKKVFLEESAGLILLNDRTFSDRNYWEYGISFSLASGIDFRDFESYGIKLSLGFNYGLTFNKTSLYYNLISLQMNYYF